MIKINCFQQDDTNAQCLKMKIFTQIMHQPGFEPTTYSRRQDSSAYNHLATQIVRMFGSTLEIYPTSKIDQL